MRLDFIKVSLLCSLSLFLVTGGYAGSRVHENAILPVDDIAQLSKKVEQIAAEQGARVFLISRIGRPQSELPDGVEYTHISFAVYSTIKTDDGREVPGYAIYNLYQDSDNPAKSSLVVDFPIDFLAGAQVPRVGMVIPRLDLQKRLYEVIHSATYNNLHNPEYSAIANPFNTRYQNCTEHTLDVLNAAIYQTDDINEIKNVAGQYFTAHTLKIDPFKLFLGSMFKADIKTSDHKGKVSTATFGSIVKYLEEFGLTESVYHVEL